ncbi:TPA: hypothetical protein PCI38_000568 [Klebsiella pneumoniae]|nr:hypothetical protein [Klebsiella pneumoniae]
MNIIEKPSWHENITLIARGDKVEGGRLGGINVQAKQLADRTALLKQRIESIDDAKDRTFFITDDDPDGTIAGLKETPAGKVFRVAQGPDAEYAFIYYANVENTALPVGRYISDMYVKNRLVDVLSSPRKVPVTMDKIGQVAIWLEDGLINGTGLHKDISPVLDMKSNNRKVALNVDGEGKVAIWIEDGLVNMSGLHSDVLRDIISQIELPDETPKNISGAGTLWKYRAKKAKLDLKQPAKITIGLSGDSWTEHKTIAQVIANYFYDKYGKAGDGWLQMNIDNPNLMNNITLTRSGWSVYDASATSASPTYPTPVDGQYIFSAGKDAVLSLGNVFAKSVRIFYYDGDGTFSYTVNGADPVVVKGNGTNKVVSVMISGLDITKATAINIDLTGNTGTVVIYSFYAEGTGNGVEVSKFGNGGITAPQYIKTLPYLKQTAGIVAPDVLVLIIGTNDYRQSVPLQSFRDGLTRWIQAWQAEIPDSAIILVAPPQCNATGNNPLSAFRDIMRDVAKERGVEFFSLYDAMDTSYAKSSAQGLWKDSLHLSDVGAVSLFNQLNHYFLEA